MIKPAKCSLCGKPVTPKSAPFCSQGCKDRDLLAWLGEGYRLPVREDEIDDETGLDTGRTD